MRPIAFFLASLFFFPAAVRAESRTIVFLGDSITAGYGLAEEDSFPIKIQKLISKDHLYWSVVNAGVSGDTTMGGLQRLDWVLRSSPTIVFVALGANDGLRGVEIPVARANLEKIIIRLKSAGITPVLAGMKLPVNYGNLYRREFRGVFPAIANKYQLPFYPFLLEGVATHPQLTLPDGLHPNEKGTEIIARNVYQFIKPILLKIPRAPPLERGEMK